MVLPKKVEDAIQGITGITWGSYLRTREKSLVEQNYRLVDDQSVRTAAWKTALKLYCYADATSKMHQLGSMMNAGLIDE